MPRKRRRRANWPYRFALLGLVTALLAYVGIQTVIGQLTYARIHGEGTDAQLAFVASLLNATIGMWFVAVGASVGSFLNVVAYRLPLGRHVGGHSACPFCQTQIRSSDNIPVLAWIKLRGRCRACRLPISIQYPVVEFFVGVVFFIVFLTEFRLGGGNLPGVSIRESIFRVGITSELVMRLVVYLFSLSGLIASALIAIKRQVVPMVLYLIALSPLFVLSLAKPSIPVVRWREAEASGFLETRMDAFTTLLCGLVAGLAIARVMAPLVYKGFDRSLLARDRSTNGARQFIGAMGTAGAIVGWQSVVPLAWTVLVIAWLCTGWLRRWFENTCFRDLTIWVWLGLLVFRASWSWWYSIPLPESVPPVVFYVAGAFLLAPLCLAYVVLTPIQEVSETAVADDGDEDDYDFEDETVETVGEQVNPERKPDSKETESKRMETMPDDQGEFKEDRQEDVDS